MYQPMATVTKPPKVLLAVVLSVVIKMVGGKNARVGGLAPTTLLYHSRPLQHSTIVYRCTRLPISVFLSRVLKVSPLCLARFVAKEFAAL